MGPRHTARAVILHDNKLLLIERWRPGYHYFSVPGGGIEPGENPEQTVVREIAEETGCVVEVQRQIYTLVHTDHTEHYIFLCRYVSGEPHLSADSPEAQQGPDNRFEPRWVSVFELPDIPFLVWQPLKEQLLHDLQYGFAAEVHQLAG